MVKVDDQVTYVDYYGNEHEAIVTHVWSAQCVNLKVELHGLHPTSVLRVDYFPEKPSGSYWKP